MAQARNPFLPLEAVTPQGLTGYSHEDDVEPEFKVAQSEQVDAKEEEEKSTEDRIDNGELIYMGKTEDESIFFNTILNTYEYLDVDVTPGAEDIIDD